MISDDELERLAEESALEILPRCEDDFDEGCHVEGIYRGDIREKIEKGFKAGYRTALDEVCKRWPSEDDIWNVGAHFYLDHTERHAFCNGLRWLRGRLGLGAE